MIVDFIKNLFSQSNELEVIEALNQGAYLVDVRTSGEFGQGSVEGAVNIPLDAIQNHLFFFQNKKHIIVFCRSGMRSKMAMNLLNKNGFENVINGKTWQNVNTLLKNK